MTSKVQFVLIPFCMLLLGVNDLRGQSDPPKDGGKAHHVMIHVASSEQAKAIQEISFKHIEPGAIRLSKVIQELRSKYTEPGNVFADVSDELLSELRTSGFEVVEHLYQETKSLVLDENIRNIYLGPKTETRAGRPAMASYVRDVPYEASDFQLWFFDANAAKISSTPYGGTLEVSKLAQFAAILWGPTKPGGEARWEIRDGSGQKVGETQIPFPYDEPKNHITPSDAGNWIENAWFEGKRMSFHSKDGKARTDISFADREGVEPMLDLSSDSQFLLVQFTKIGLEEIGLRRNEVFLYDHNGHKVWEFIPEEQFSCALRRPYVSRDGSFAVVSFVGSDYGRRSQGVPRVTYLLGKGGTVIRKISDIAPFRLEFSSTGKYVVLSDDKVMLLETGSGKTLFEFSAYLRKGNDVLQVAENAQLVAVADNYLITILDFKGNRVWEIRNPVNTPYTMISFSDNGNEISLASGNTFVVYKRKE